MSNIGVIGAGAFGTALASVLASGGHNVTLWGRDCAAMAQIRSTRQTPYLPGITLPDTLQTTANLSDLGGSDAVLMVVPAQVTRMVLKSSGFARITCPILMCAKGIELGTARSQTDILHDEQPHHTGGVISGPGFAAEIASGKPTALTLAVADPSSGQDLQVMLSTTTLRMYLSDDVKGVQLGGALKNVYAIACGIVRGAGLGESAQAALLTRGFAELKSLAAKMGAKPETLSGLSCFGDLVLSCTSLQSRNFAFGHQVGISADFAQTKTVEGIATALAVGALADQYKVEMPICAAVSAVLQKQLSVEAALKQLMSRPLKREV
ncbi:MAG: NAD(P)-dependent glycerol-3-phosphate dehydrogenase [Proteobacteria bacterium]|nr:NAD(P)-dependent glycerol-3-phosphate dehydrogenase [Pseudomonadota bacterium]